MTPSRTHRPSRLAPAVTAAALVLLAGTACAPADAQPTAPTPTTTSPIPSTTYRPPTPTPAPTPAPTTPRRTTSPPPVTRTTPAAPSVSGRVVDGRTGRPMAGVIVEFKNLRGGNVHTYTGSDGTYAVRLPPDVYTALALTDDPDTSVGFEVVGGDSSVSVPPSARVDFESYTYG